jgi:hypothetical protein
VCDAIPELESDAHILAMPRVLRHMDARCPEMQVRSLSVRMVCRPWVLDIGSEMPRDVDHVATTRSYCDHNINENE